MYIELEQTDSIITELKQRYQKIKDDGFVNIDSNIIPLLERFNRFDNVVTCWSCGGHPPRYVEIDDEYHVIGEWNFPHIICAVGIDGHHILGQYFIELIHHPAMQLNKSYYLAKLQLSPLVSPLDTDTNNKKYPEYLSNTIEFKSTDPKEIGIFINVSIEILDRMIVFNQMRKGQ